MYYPYGIDHLIFMHLGNVGQKPNSWCNSMDFNWTYTGDVVESHELTKIVTVLPFSYDSQVDSSHFALCSSTG